MKKLAFLMLLGCGVWAAQEHAAPAAEHEAEAHEAADPLLPAKWVNFAILAGALGYMAVKFGGPALRGQQQAIVDALGLAAKRAEAAAQKVAEIERQIAGLNGEVAALRSKAETELKAEAARLEKETALTMAKLEQSSEQEIASAAKFARAELKAHAAALALDLAVAKVQARMDSATQGALVDRFVAKLNEQREVRE